MGGKVQISLCDTIWSKESKALVPLYRQGDRVDSNVRGFPPWPRVLLPELVHYHWGMPRKPFSQSVLCERREEGGGRGRGRREEGGGRREEGGGRGREEGGGKREEGGGRREAG